MPQRILIKIYLGLKKQESKKIYKIKCLKEVITLQ